MLSSSNHYSCGTFSPMSLANLLIILNWRHVVSQGLINDYIECYSQSCRYFSFLNIDLFHDDTFIQKDGFTILSCLICDPHMAEKFRTTILGQRWRQQIKLVEYSTAFPSAPATHFTATSPREPNTYTEPHICSRRERQVDERKKQSMLSHPSLLVVGCEDLVSVSRLQLWLPRVLAP